MIYSTLPSPSIPPLLLFSLLPPSLPPWLLCLYYLRLALLQLAVRDAVFLLDMVHLPQTVPVATLRQFVEDVFGSKNSLKLGQSRTQTAV